MKRLVMLLLVCVVLATSLSAVRAQGGLLGPEPALPCSARLTLYLPGVDATTQIQINRFLDAVWSAAYPNATALAVNCAPYYVDPDALNRWT